MTAPSASATTTSWALESFTRGDEFFAGNADDYLNITSSFIGYARGNVIKLVAYIFG